ncbi:nucleotide exchange factor GrpE [bacterium]|nr:nucleotide exchange factor GrpE [bacterium]
MDNVKKIAEKRDKMREKENNRIEQSEKINEEVFGSEKGETKEIENNPVKKHGFGEVHGGKKRADKKSGSTKKSVKKREKKKGKDLVDLLQHKNIILENIRKELDQTKELLEIKEDRLLRMVAEFDNFKKRINREQNLLKKRMYADVLGDLLPVLDDFDRAFEAQKDPVDDFSKGIKLIHNRLNGILTNLGIEEIDANGQTFNPEFHEAMGEIETDMVEVGKVAHVVQKGYMLDNVVIRPARVIVSGTKKGKKE